MAPRGLGVWYPGKGCKSDLCVYLGGVSACLVVPQVWFEAAVVGFVLRLFLEACWSGRGRSEPFPRTARSLWREVNQHAFH